MKSKGVILAAIFATALCFSGHVFAALSGSGTEANPYLIQSRADFDEFANPANSAIYWTSGVYTKLMCDPNLSGTTYTQAPIAPDTSTNSGFQGTQFTGVFDGNGHTIFNLTINQSTKDYIGLFGYIGTGGQVKNLGVLNANVNGRNYVGGLTGNNSGTISNCYSTGAVSGGDSSSKIGGLCGQNRDGNIIHCYSTCTVTGGNYSEYLGGLCGYRSGGNISNCYSTGAVNGGNNSSWIGGLCGTNLSVSNNLSSCFSTSNITGGNSSRQLGGLCGNTEGSIINCYAFGTVTGGDFSYDIGGLCGRTFNSTISLCYATGNVATEENSGHLGGLCGFVMGSTIEECFASGSVSGGSTSSHIGGFCGRNYSGSSISNSYAMGSVFGDENSYYIGGFCGGNYATITNCYSISSLVTGTGAHEFGGFNGISLAGLISRCYFLDTAGPDNGYGTPLDNVNMTIQANFVGWDFTTPFWMMLRPNEDYPRLAWQTIIAGDVAGLYGVDMADLMEVVNNWLEQGCPAGCEQADIDNSGTVDLADLSILAANWMMGV
jgi:hypothetical protein